MNLKGIIFDFDGTLADTLPICFEAFRNTFIKYGGKHYSDKEISCFFGPTEVGILRQASVGNIDDALEYYLQESDRLHMRQKQPFDGIVTMLKFLKDKGVKLAVVSGKGPRSMEISLGYTELSQ